MWNADFACRHGIRESAIRRGRQVRDDSRAFACDHAARGGPRLEKQVIWTDVPCGSSGVNCTATRGRKSLPYRPIFCSTASMCRRASSRDARCVCQTCARWAAAARRGRLRGLVARHRAPWLRAELAAIASAGAGCLLSDRGASTLPRSGAGARRPRFFLAAVRLDASRFLRAISRESVLLRRADYANPGVDSQNLALRELRVRPPGPIADIRESA